MNYTKIYDNLISSRKTLNRKKKRDGVYYEKHHIIPKCFGGPNTKENLVLLTFKEHFLAHLLLVEMYEGKAKNKMAYSLYRMCGVAKNNKRKIVSSRQYNLARTIFVENFSGSNHPNFGKEVSKDTRDRMSKSNKGKNKGKKHSQDTKNLISENRKGIPNSPKTREKISIALKGKTSPMKGKHHSDIGKANISKATKGLKRGDLTKQRMSESSKGKPKSELHKKHIGDAKRGIKQSPELIEKRAAGVRGEKNGMAGKSLHDVWVEKYGQEEADKRLIAYKEKMSLTFEKKREAKLKERELFHSTFGK